MLLPLLRASLCAALGAALLATATPVSSADLAGSNVTQSSQRANSDRGNAIILANQILNRWQPVAEQAGAMTPVWREQYLAQLASMEVSTLQDLDRFNAEPAGNVKARYAQFIEGFQSAVMQTVMLSANGKGQLKLGSTTTDQVFIPMTPCRIVDTRNVGGPIAASTQRAFNWVRGSNAFSWSEQGGAPGPGATACPGTVFDYAGGTLPGDPTNSLSYPSAAVATVTVVNPTAAGNLVVWGGAGTFPQSSALNFDAGQTLANTTMIPWGGRVSAGVQDFTIRYNGPSGQADVVVDLVGFFVQNRGTALQCLMTESHSGTLDVGANQPQTITPPDCPLGYTFTTPLCSTLDRVAVYLAQLGPTPYACSFINNTGSLAYVSVRARCCRVPGTK